MSTSADSNRLIAVFGATGQQGGAIVRALQARGQFRVRALSRNPDQHRGLADEVVEANLDQPDTLAAALRGVHGVFLVTNFWSEGSDERKQATAAIEAAKAAGVEIVAAVLGPSPDTVAVFHQAWLVLAACCLVSAIVCMGLQPQTAVKPAQRRPSKLERATYTSS